MNQIRFMNTVCGGCFFLMNCLMPSTVQFALKIPLQPAAGERLTSHACQTEYLLRGY